MEPRFRKAAKGYADFTGDKPSRVVKSQLPASDVVGWKMGPAVGVAYEATRDGERQRYFHEFGAKARPDLIASDDGRQLYFAGGRYKVTERGIEDMPTLFMVNPSPRRGKAKAATRRKPMAAARRRRRTTRRRATRQVAVFRANPRPRRRRRYTARRRSSFLSNPRPRRIRRRSYRRNPVARRRSFRRNPIGGVNFGKMLMPAAGIGLGAVGTEIIMGYLPIPANLKTGVMRHVTKGAVGIAAGLVLGKLFRQKRLGDYFALGAVAIAVHDAVKEMIASRMPAIQMAQYQRPIRSSFAGMGYANPAQTLRLGQYVAPVAGTMANIEGRCGETNFAV